jgi:ABC-type glycerol-3-phosphate transport system substrate-binding protein
VPEVLSALETDGKLYMLSTHFSVETAVANPRIVGELSSWTLDDALALLKRYPGAKPYGGMEARSPFEYGLERFVDWETGECRFTGEEFLKFLDYAKMYVQPGTPQTEVRELAQFSSVNNFLTHQVNKQRYGDDLTYLGRYPGTEGSGNVIMPSGLMAISSSCEHKDVAWAFISSLLTEDIQTAGNSHSWLFPTNAAAMRNKAREAMESEMNVTLYGEIIKMPAMTQADIDAVYALLATVDGRTKGDETLAAIVSEEAAPYFAGAKTAEESARLIQSRATLYVNEQK